jgi:hypothetical protein
LITLGVVADVGATTVVEGGIDVTCTTDDVGEETGGVDVESLVNVTVVVGEVVRLTDVVVLMDVTTESVADAVSMHWLGSLQAKSCWTHQLST